MAGSNSKMYINLQFLYSIKIYDHFDGCFPVNYWFTDCFR